MNTITYSYLNIRDKKHLQKGIELYKEIRNDPYGYGKFLYNFTEEGLTELLRASECLGAWDGEELVGLGILVLDKEDKGINNTHRDLLKLESKTSMAELGFYVHFNYCNKGIAKTLAEKLMNYAREININIITATAHAENKPSIRLLTHQEFVFVTEYIRGDGDKRNLYRKMLTL